MSITVRTSVNVSLEKAWLYFTTPEHIEKWNAASPDWYCPKVENDLKSGGRFKYKMEAKDGSFGFDLTGIYDGIIEHNKIAYTLDDGRKVEVLFNTIDDNNTELIETFEPEKANSEAMQQAGWQAILDNFKSYVTTI